jgi:WD40 repeat protein
MSPSPGSGPLTITFSKTVSHCQWIVSQWDGVDPSGVNGAGAIVQTGSSRADAVTGLAVTLGALGDANNVAYGVFGVRQKVLAVTPGTGFTEIAEQPSAESPLSDLEAEWATNDNTIDASWANLSAGALGVEIKAGNRGPVTPVVSVDVTPASASVLVGGTVQLTATAQDAEGEPLSGRTFTWATDAPAVATVSAAGLVTGMGEGAATITATSEGKSGSASVTVTSGGQSALVGRWSSVLPAPVVQLHLHLLPDGKVLSWGHDGAPQLWDPATGNFTPVPSPSLLFCAGHDFLPDGRLLVAGGAISNGLGLPNTNIFDVGSGSWQVGPPMAKGRWYPTNTTLPDGEVLTVAGEDESGAIVAIPEVWNGTSWRQLTTASLELFNYPRMFVAPDGRVFQAGAERLTRYLDVTGTGRWTDGPLRQFGARSYGSAVMYEPGKILYVGGANPPTNTAEIIDLNQPSPQWTYTGSLAYARWNLNATVLPTGEVLVTGGVAGNRANASLAVHAAELWDPATGSWTTLASSAALLRGYHSTSVLLPDGRVLHAGGGDGGGTPDNLNYELYSPPYFFKGARPNVTGATPSVVGYGQTVIVGTPDGASIAKVTLIRLGSATHAFDQGQRLVPLSFSQVGGGLSITIPASRTAAPPGPYLLFLVNGNGVPSVGRIMRLQ